MGTLFQKALYLKKYFSIGIFVAVCLCLLKTEIKQEKLLIRCVFIIIMTVCILSVSFNFSPWSRVKNKKKSTSQHSNIE